MTITSSSAKVLEDANNVREDLGNVIFNVTPFQTPFTSNIPKTAAKADLHEWLTDTYRASASNNAAIEAVVKSGVAGSTRTRKGNYIQIADEEVTVTKKAEMLDKAGIPGKEMAYQLMKKGKELHMDVENQCLSNQVRVAPTASAAGVSASVCSWIYTNHSVGSGVGVANTASTGATQPTFGTDRTMSDTLLQAELDGVWENSGDFSNVVLMADATRVGSCRDNLTGMSSTIEQDSKSGEIFARVAVYVSQFGPVRVVPNKHALANTIYILDYSTWGLAFAGGKKIHTTDIATQTSAEQKLIECYYTLEARSEEANGAVYDIT